MASMGTREWAVLDDPFDVPAEGIIHKVFVRLEEPVLVNVFLGENLLVAGQPGADGFIDEFTRMFSGRGGFVAGASPRATLSIRVEPPQRALVGVLRESSRGDEDLPIKFCTRITDVDGQPNNMLYGYGISTVRFTA